VGSVRQWRTACSTVRSAAEPAVVRQLSAAEDDLQRIRLRRVLEGLVALDHVAEVEPVADQGGGVEGPDAIAFMSCGMVSPEGIPVVRVI
jgi:hypothetical protein